jgi:hypothetical protein
MLDIELTDKIRLWRTKRDIEDDAKASIKASKEKALLE